MENWFKQKNVFITALIGAVISLITITYFKNGTGDCSEIQIDALNDLYNNCLFAGSLTLIFIPILVFSTILFFIKDNKIYSAWVKFTVTYTPVYLLIVATRPSQSDFLNPSQKDTAIALSLGYFILGIFFVAFNIWKLSREKNGHKLSMLASGFMCLLFLGAGILATFFLINI